MRKLRLKFIAIGLISLFMFSCSSSVNDNANNSNGDENNNENNNNENNNNENNNDQQTGNLTLDYGSEEFKNFFNSESEVKITLNFSNEALYKLAHYGTSGDFYKTEMYHPCDVEILVNEKLYTFNEVGARMKGNTSRNDAFINEDGTFNSKEVLCHFKLAFDRIFNDSSINDYYIKDYSEEEIKERDERRLFGMKKIDLKWNKNYDSSFTKELYSLYAFRDANVISQHGNLVNLTIKTEKDSASTEYLAYEVIDKTMIKSVFSEKSEQKGDLYKCTYTSAGTADLSSSDLSKIGIESNNFKPSYDLKTNEEKSDHSTLKNFIDELGKRNVSSEEIKPKFDELLDVDYFLRFAAMSWVVGSPDDYRNNYNNYYLYFNSLSNKAYFIPYDNDRVFGILKDWPIDTSRQDMCSDRLDGTVTSNGCGNPIVRRLLADGSSTRPIIKEYEAKYRSYATEYAIKYLNANKFKEFSEKYKLANKDLSGGQDNMSFETYANNKLGTLR